MISLTMREEEQIAAIKGITSEIKYRTGKLPSTHCPLLKSELKKIAQLSDSLAIMAQAINVQEE